MSRWTQNVCEQSLWKKQMCLGTKLPSSSPLRYGSPAACQKKRLARGVAPAAAGDRAQEPTPNPSSNSSPPVISSLPVYLATAGFQKVEQCLVYPPITRPTTIVNFVGGSFIGAAPDLFYSYFIKLLVDEGFLVVATLYDVSFDHILTSSSVQSRFQKCWETLNYEGIPSAGLAPADVSSLPVFGVGHSLGALMLALVGNQDNLMASPGAPRGHVIISYTNKPVAYFASNLDRIGPAVNQLTTTFQSALAAAPGIVLAGLEEAFETVQRTELPTFFPPQQVDPLLRFYGAFAPAATDLTNGISEYFPSPEDNLKAISSRYSVQANLLIQCKEDPVEDSPALEAALRKRAEGATGQVMEVKRLVVPGTHFTPLAPAVDWRVGGVFSPVDALAAAAKAGSLADIRVMAKAVAQWIRECSLPD